MLPSPPRKPKYTGSDYPVDRISSLPTHIIHGILSLLPAKDATRTSVLSKTFYSQWTFFPVIDLYFYDVTHWNSSKMIEFMDYLNRMLRRRRLETAVEKFHLRFPLCKPYSSNGELLDLVTDSVNQIIFVNAIIEFLIANRVQDLSIDFSFHTTRPPIIIGNANSITKLNMLGVELPNFCDPLLDWSWLVSLRLWHCSGFQAFKLLSSKIRSIVLGPCRGLNSVVIESPSLEKFKCVVLGFDEVEINISKCQNLKKLTLCSVSINDEWIRDNIPTFAGLEKLKLDDNCCLEDSKIWNDNVRKMRIMANNRPASTIEIRAKNLKSLSFHLMNGPCKIRIGSCTHLRKLSVDVRASSITHSSVEEFLNEFLKEQVAKLNELESLELFVTSYIHRLELHHKQLKRLELDLFSYGGSYGFGEVVVHAPNLVSLIYSWYFTPIQLLNTKNLLETELIIDEDYGENDDYFLKLWELIRSFGLSQNLTLCCSAQKYLIFPKEFREKLVGQELQNRDHLKVSPEVPYKISTELLDSLLGLWPTLKTLCFVEYAAGHDSSIKFQHEMDSKEEEPQRCWQHSLRTVELNNFDVVDREDLTNYFKEHAKFLDAVL